MQKTGIDFDQMVKRIGENQKTSFLTPTSVPTIEGELVSPPSLVPTKKKVGTKTKKKISGKRLHFEDSNAGMTSSSKRAKAAFIDDEAEDTTSEVDSTETGSVLTEDSDGELVHKEKTGTKLTNQQGKAWCFTFNNPHPGDLKRIKRRLEECVNWAIIGFEFGTEKGTPHLQGYAWFKTNKRFNAVKELIGLRSHIEKAEGTHEQNFVYCSKDKEFIELGQRPTFVRHNGEREQARWEKIWQLAKENRIEECDGNVRVQHYGSLVRIAKDFMKPTADADGVTGIWIQGPSGCGKSRKARADYPDAYLKNANKWWDGYQNQRYVIIDDLDPDHKCLGHLLKIWADRYSFTAENKGGAMAIRPEKIVVTSQYRIKDIWPDVETREAITRRFEVIDMFPEELYPIFNASQIKNHPPTPVPESPCAPVTVVDLTVDTPVKVTTVNPYPPGQVVDMSGDDIMVGEPMTVIEDFTEAQKPIEFDKMGVQEPKTEYSLDMIADAI